MTTRFRLHNYGSINIDHVYRVPHLVRPGETLASREYRPVLGGKGANQSLAMARAGGDVTHWGRLGESDRWALAPLREAGVSSEQIELIEGPSGHTVIQVDDEGENAIVLFGGANQGFDATRLDTLFATTTPGDWLLLQNECNDTATVIEHALEAGLHVAFNPAPMVEAIRQLPLERLALLFLNRVEAATLAECDEKAPTEQLIQALTERYPGPDIVLTLGRDGAHFLPGRASNESVLFEPALKVRAVDTTGAGDTFIGYFLAALQANRTISECLARASAAAALGVQRSGAADSIPLKEEVERLLAESS
ncbi:ribokinase [Kushneria phosphatilytica]|uniref:Ribokinase n=1 Tax=Kushneria phosphatilytica TaxID=657387 RepID=A0A1S1NV65_9GAMM|nr:ribokinase [Kushneria phosphatilytica]OHV08766.1 ribokinase [Kushneria phosphatilytica]QEL12485.1 ribokinase [Kushneria phosphatilytica]